MSIQIALGFLIIFAFILIDLTVKRLCHNKLFGHNESVEEPVESELCCQQANEITKL